MRNPWNPFEHHRGPFRLKVCRPSPPTGGRKYPATFETLRGTTHGSDVEAEARALLADPRDTISAVYVYSETEQQYVVTYKREAHRG